MKRAVQFLGTDKAAGVSRSEKEAFLEKKGLSQEEIAAAFVRHGRASAGESSVPEAVSGESKRVIRDAQVVQYPSIPPYEEPAPGPWWAWLLAGATAGGALAFLASALRLRWQPAPVPQAFDSQGRPLIFSGSPPVWIVEQPRTGPQDVKLASSYESCMALMRQYSEETQETVVTLQRSLQLAQEQHQKVFAEMANFLQSANQHKDADPAPVQLSASSLNSLAAMITCPSGPAALDSVQSASRVTCGSASTDASPAPASAGNTKSLRESFDSITTNLDKLIQESSTKEAANKALNTLSMVLRNVLTNPSQERNRKVNTSGNRFAQFKEGAAAELLKLSGFEYQEQPGGRPGTFTFPADHSTEAMQRVHDFAEEKKRNVDMVWAARPAEVPASVAEPLAEVPFVPPSLAPRHPAEASPVETGNSEPQPQCGG